MEDTESATCVTGKMMAKRIRTITAQINYLFVTDVLHESLLACDTGSRQRVFGNRLSDHLPIVADFASEETTRVAAPASV